MLADVFPVSHTCRLRTFARIDIRLVLTCASASSMAKRASGTFIYVLTHGEVQIRDFCMGGAVNEMFLMLLKVTALFNVNPAGSRKMVSECHDEGKALTFIEY